MAEIHNAEPDVCSVIVRSHYNDGIKHADKPIINKNYNGPGRKMLLK